MTTTQGTIEGLTDELTPFSKLTTAIITASTNIRRAGNMLIIY